MRRRLWLGSGAIVLLLWLGYLVLNRLTAAQVDRPACVPSASTETSMGTSTGIRTRAETCYHRPQLISSRETTAIVQVPGRAEVISSTGNQIDWWDLATGKRLTSWQTESWITALAISPNGRLLASAGMDQTIRLWDLETGVLLGEIGSGRVSSLAFSPTGRILASGSRLLQWADGTMSFPGVQLWDVQNQELLDSLGKDPVNAIAFSPDGRFLASGERNTKLWRLGRNQTVRTLDSGSVTALEFSADGQLLFTGSSRIKVWDTRAGRLLHTLDAGASDLALSADHRLLAAAIGGTVNLWQLRNLSPNRQLDRQPVTRSRKRSAREAERQLTSPRREPPRMGRTEARTEEWLGTLRGSYYSNISLELNPTTGTITTAGSDGIKVWQPQPEAVIQATR